MSAPLSFRFIPCCPGQGQEVEYQLFAPCDAPPGFIGTGVYNVGINTYDELGNAILIQGNCYRIVQGGLNGVAPCWPGGSLTYLGGDVCPENPTLCPCTLQQSLAYNVYTIQSCCGGPLIPIYLENAVLTEGLNLYTGPSLIPGIESGCYTVTSVLYNGLGVPPYTLVADTDFEIQDPEVTCTSEVCAFYCDPCTCVQLENTGETTITVRYYDCAFDNTTINILPGEKSEKFCYTSWITFPPTAVAEYFGNCNLNEDTQEFSCPGCYLLEDCDQIAQSIYSLDPALALYADTAQSIMITGSDVCWKVISSDDNCECAISTTIANTYYNCEACKERKGYKLTECTTRAIIYTTTDLSDYESVFITSDCPGCWYVEPIDFIPPTDQPVTPMTGFESCKLCNATYYELVDCLGIKDPIITIDDLSEYVGKVIKIKYCPETCWEVIPTTPQPLTGEVIFEEEFDGCPECLLEVLPCVCSTALNDTLFPISGLRYVDCEGNTVFTSPLNAGERSSKICVKYWLTGTDQIFYGDCVDGQCQQPPQPKRQVTPGYNTPVCSTEYYEKVECNFSEWMYNEVLEKRYGISNCCPEELMKWEIKHEMLMLDVLINPDYNCTSTTTCDCPVLGGMTVNTACPDITQYILERCNEPEITEVVRIDNQYDVLGNVIVIDDQCYTVVEPTNRLVTVYWTPGTIYETCTEAGCPSPPPVVTYNCVDFTCVEVQGSGGTYQTLVDCQSNCTAPPSPWKSEACVFGFMDSLDWAFESEEAGQVPHTILSLVINGTEYITPGNEYSYGFNPYNIIPANNNQFGQTYTNQVDGMNSLFLLLGLEELVKAQVVTNDIWAMTVTEFGSAAQGGYYLILANTVNTISFIIDDNTGFVKTHSWINGVASVVIDTEGYEQIHAINYEYATCVNVNDEPFTVTDGVVIEPPF